MKEYVYELFGVWWLFIESDAPGPIHMQGPYPTKDAAESNLSAAATGPAGS